MTTIRQSERIYFNNINSETLGITSVNIASGMQEEPIWGSRSLNETKVKGKSIPVFHSVEEEPLSFTLNLAFDTEWTSDSLREVMRWLRADLDFYVPLIFSAKPDLVCYAMVVDSPTLVHNSNSGGYIVANFRTDSPYFYGNVESVYYDLTTNPSGTNVEIMNGGDLDVPCNVLIKKKNDGNITITNLSDSGSIVSITSLKDGQYLLVDSEHEEIESSATSTLTFTGVVSDGQTVTITSYGSSQIYEFDTNNLITSGNVKVDVSAGASASQAVTALVNAINNNPQSNIEAVDGVGDIVVIYSKKTGVEGSDYTTSETLVNGSWSGSTFSTVYNHSTWDGNILTLKYGKNVLNISGTCEIKFIYQYIMLAGE